MLSSTIAFSTLGFRSLNSNLENNKSQKHTVYLNLFYINLHTMSNTVVNCFICIRVYVTLRINNWIHNHPSELRSVQVEIKIFQPIYFLECDCGRSTLSNLPPLQTMFATPKWLKKSQPLPTNLYIKDMDYDWQGCLFTLPHSLGWEFYWVWHVNVTSAFVTKVIQ